VGRVFSQPGLSPILRLPQHADEHRTKVRVLLGWGGRSGAYGYEFAEAFLGDGAAYDPVTDSWWMPPEALLHTPRTSPPLR
jgi:hypothetical protein